jgi:FkbM family methyltransferase
MVPEAHRTSQRASMVDRLTYELLIRTAGVHQPVVSDLWTRLWGTRTPRFQGHTEVTLHGHRVLLNAGYAYPAFSRRWSTYNDPLVEIVHQTAAHLGRPASVVDVGAAVGDTVLLLLERCPEDVDRFYCVEPDLEFFEYLTHNLGDRADVELFCTMLSDAEERERDVVRIHSGTASPQGQRTRQASLLDTLLAHAPSIDVLKIDTDGFDGRVLSGSTGLLSAHQPSVIFEWHPILLDATGQDWSLPFQVLREHGYRWYVWFTKEGSFSHIDDGFDYEATSILGDLSRAGAMPRSDWHYDVVALTEAGPSPSEVAALGHATSTHAAARRPT